MRFHRFKVENYQEDFDEIGVDLDSIVFVEKHAPERTLIAFGPRARVVLVVGTFDEVMALVSPPAAPDTFEEDLAQAKDELMEAAEAAAAAAEAQAAKEATHATGIVKVARTHELMLLTEVIEKDKRVSAEAAIAIAGYIVRRLEQLQLGKA